MGVLIPGLIIICGLQGGGKSHLIRYILHKNQEKFDWGLVFLNTGFSADNFNYIDKWFVHAKYDEDALANLKSIHEQLVEQGKKPFGFVIFDDCLFGQQWLSIEVPASHPPTILQ
jgi:predicted alpha/beta-fold hydrolase